MLNFGEVNSKNQTCDTLQVNFQVCCLVFFGFCNQAKSLAPTLKILLVFLCEAAANQLQQLKDCCGVSHVLGSMHHWLVMY